MVAEWIHNFADDNDDGFYGFHRIDSNLFLVLLSHFGHFLCPFSLSKDSRKEIRDKENMDNRQMWDCSGFRLLKPQNRLSLHLSSSFYTIVVTTEEWRDIASSTGNVTINTNISRDVRGLVKHQKHTKSQRMENKK